MLIIRKKRKVEPISTSLHLTFLGTGTSQGVPVIGCDCAVCCSLDERDRRLRTSAMVEVSGKRFIIDAGPDFREQMLREDETALKDECLRAFGVLTNCAILPMKELTAGRVKVKLGIMLGFFKTKNIRHFNEFLSNMQPATFRLSNDLRKATEYECDLVRAEIMRKVLQELVVRTD